VREGGLLVFVCVVRKIGWVGAWVGVFARARTRVVTLSALHVYDTHKHNIKRAARAPEAGGETAR
jgi:hypothetical protein